MKKIIFGFILGLVVAGGIAGVVAYNYNAKDIGFTPSDDSWNVNNVEDAIKYLKNNSSGGSNLLWHNDDPIQSVNTTNIDVDLSSYNSVFIIGVYASDQLNYAGYIKIDVGSSGVLTACNQNGCNNTRNITVNSNGIIISNGAWQGNACSSCAIPIYVFGIK